MLYLLFCSQSLYSEHEWKHAFLAAVCRVMNAEAVITRLATMPILVPGNWFRVWPPNRCCVAKSYFAR